jgi:hypothetical protein
MRCATASSAAPWTRGAEPLVLLPVLYPDADLRPRLAPVPVGVRTPNPRPATFLTVRRAGGIAERMIDRARMDIFAWADSDPAAHDLVMQVRQHLAAMPGLRGGVRVTDVAEFAGPLPAPDESGQPRWLVTFEIALRGTA